jgi:hypothetical protein
MRIGVKMQQNVTGARETRDYVTFVRPTGADVEVEFVYTADPPMDQDSGWFVVPRDEALKLAHALIAVADGCTGGEQASYSVDHDGISDTSIGK